MKKNNSSSKVFVDANSLRKKRGPYNKLSKKKRLDKVRKLYFEEGYPIVDVAKTLGVHRNTTTSDVKYWIGQYEKQGIGDEITEFFYKQKSLLESQKLRFLKKLKKEPDFESQHKLEKLLFGLHDRETKFYLRFVPKVIKTSKISKKLVKKIIRELAFDDFSFFNQDDLIKAIIYNTKCDVSTAKLIVLEMRKLGLDYARDFSVGKTSMIGLAIICGYLSSEESYKILQEQTQREEQEEREYQKDLI